MKWAHIERLLDLHHILVVVYVVDGYVAQLEDDNFSIVRESGPQPTIQAAMDELDVKLSLF